MGAFYTNIAVKTGNQSEVAGYLRKLRRTAYVSPTAGGVTFVYDEKCEQEPEKLKSLLERLSEKFSCPALAAMNHDDDIFMYWLYRDGKPLDYYNSDPEYFSRGGESPRHSEGGDPAALASEFGADPENIRAILSRKKGEGGYVFESERHGDLAEALGLDARYSTLDFGSIDGGAEEVPGREGFIKVGAGPAAQARKFLKLVDEQKERLLSEGPLLAEFHQRRKARELPPHPVWCMVPSSCSVLIGWGSLNAKESVPVELVSPPWQQEARVLPVMLSSDVYFMTTDGSGRFLAATFSAGNWTAGVWDLESGDMLLKIPHSRIVSRAVFTDGGRKLLSLSEELVLSSVVEGKVLGKATLKETGNCLAIHPSGDYAVAGAERRLFIVETGNMRIRKSPMLGQPGWEAGAVPGTGKCFSLMFDPEGRILFAATMTGVHAYQWRDLLAVGETMPAPVLSVSAEGAEGHAPPMLAAAYDLVSAIAYDLALDRKRNLLLFSNWNGTISYLDPGSGRSETLLRLPGRASGIRLALSDDLSVLACETRFIHLLMQLSPCTLQLWNYGEIMRGKR